MYQISDEGIDKIRSDLSAKEKPRKTELEDFESQTAELRRKTEPEYSNFMNFVDLSLEDQVGCIKKEFDKGAKLRHKGFKETYMKMVQENISQKKLVENYLSLREMMQEHMPLLENHVEVLGKCIHTEYDVMHLDMLVNQLELIKGMCSRIPIGHVRSLYEKL